VKIKWQRSEDGFVTSKCGRYKIKPQFAGRVQPIWYQIEDTLPGGHGMATKDTQKDCKEWVEQQVNPPKDQRDWPKITKDML
jgi:hypothetical protein